MQLVVVPKIDANELTEEFCGDWDDEVKEKKVFISGGLNQKWACI